ncbi:hypothetical protein ACSNOK_33330, partial [Streptomyces sp. URMC 126]
MERAAPDADGPEGAGARERAAHGPAVTPGASDAPATSVNPAASAVPVTPATSAAPVTPTTPVLYVRFHPA